LEIVASHLASHCVIYRRR